MGRTDELQFVLECARAWQSLGARVTFEPGWEGRGNGLRGDYEGCLVHHTASASSAARPFPTRRILIDGRADLKGPLCNVAGPWCSPTDPWLHVIAAYPANHAGASGGRSMGPLPVTSLFNPRVLGLEIDYAGTVPMAPGQYLAGRIFGRGVTLVLGRSPEWARAHAETSITGKWDPGYAPGRTIDMPAYRRDVASLAPAPPPPSGGLTLANITDTDAARLLASVDLLVQQMMGPGYVVGQKNDAPGWPVGLYGGRTVSPTVVDALRLLVQQEKGQLDLSGRPGPDTDDQWGHLLSLRAEVRELADRPVADVNEKALADQLGPVLAAAVRGLPDEDLTRIAKAVNDEADRRARDADPATGPTS